MFEIWQKIKNKYSLGFDIVARCDYGFEINIFMNDFILIIKMNTIHGKFFLKNWHVVSYRKRIIHLGDPTSDNFPSNNGTNCCSIVAVKFSENWHLEIKSIGSNRKCFADIVEDIAQHFPTRVHPFRDIWRHYDLWAAADILLGNHLLENTPDLKELSKGTRVFTNDGRENLFNKLSN